MQGRNIVPCVSSKLIGRVPYAAQTQYAQEIPYITGITRDSSGNALPGCFVDCFTTADDVRRFSTLSDLITGAYSFQVGPNTGPYYCVGFKPGLPEVGGVTVDSLTSFSSAFNSSILTGCQLWAKSDVLSATLTDGSLIDTWSDSSGSGNTLTQSVDANKPVFKVNVASANGFPVARFPYPDTGGGTGRYMKCASLTATKPATLFAVCNTIYTGVSPILFQDEANLGLNLALSGVPTPPDPVVWRVELRKGSTVIGSGDYAITESSFCVIEATYGATGDYFIYVNGANLGSGTNDQDFSLSGKRFIGDNGSGFIGGDICELMQFNYVLSTTDRATIRNYLGRKYKITVTAR